MASLTTEQNGSRIIQFVGMDGRRRSVRLGKVSKRHAEAIKLKVEELVTCQKLGQPIPLELQSWLDETSEMIHSRLVSTGLISARQRVTLGRFLDDYIKSRSDTKPSTRTVYIRAKKHLLAHFGEDAHIRDISAGEADAFLLALKSAGLAGATIGRTIGLAKQFFRAAERSRLIRENPFSDLPSAVPRNPSRDHFVTRDAIDRVLAASTDDEWRLLVALARFGALRTPSEPLMLTWGDIDFATSKIRVRSPKTEHHHGGAERTMPLFPELLPFILTCRPPDADPSGFVITRYRQSTVNLRTRLLQTIQRAGLEPWPKLWQNMRATRETELVEEFPAHVVAAWVGHSVEVAEKHYLQVTESHFQKAVQNPVHDPVQQGHAGQSTESPAVGEAALKGSICRGMRERS